MESHGLDQFLAEFVHSALPVFLSCQIATCVLGIVLMVICVDAWPMERGWSEVEAYMNFRRGARAEF
jgi:hypothetical protein